VVREDDPRAAARQSDRQLTRVRSRQGRSFIRGEWSSRLEQSPSRCRSPPAALPSPRNCSPGTRKSQAPEASGGGASPSAHVENQRGDCRAAGGGVKCGWLGRRMLKFLATGCCALPNG
jgi:hypothetical protein